MSRPNDNLSQFKFPFDYKISVCESMVGVRKAGEIMRLRIYKQIETPEDGNDLDLSDC